MIIYFVMMCVRFARELMHIEMQYFTIFMHIDQLFTGCLQSIPFAALINFKCIIGNDRFTLCAYMQCISFIGSFMSHINLRLFSYSSMLCILLHHVSPIHKLSILLLVIIFMEWASDTQTQQATITITTTTKKLHREKNRFIIICYASRELTLCECTAISQWMHREFQRNRMWRASAISPTCALSSGKV